MQPTQPTWRRYQELRPDELADCIKATPIAFWPLGLIEHHGWHLPVGYDGLKAERICIRIAENTGGVHPTDDVVGRKWRSRGFSLDTLSAGGSNRFDFGQYHQTAD